MEKHVDSSRLLDYLSRTIGQYLRTYPWDLPRLINRDVPQPQG